MQRSTQGRTHLRHPDDASQPGRQANSQAPGVYVHHHAPQLGPHAQALNQEAVASETGQDRAPATATAAALLLPPTATHWRRALAAGHGAHLVFELLHKGAHSGGEPGRSVVLCTGQPSRATESAKAAREAHSDTALSPAPRTWSFSTRGNATARRFVGLEAAPPPRDWLPRAPGSAAPYASPPPRGKSSSNAARFMATDHDGLADGRRFW